MKGVTCRFLLRKLVVPVFVTSVLYSSRRASTAPALHSSAPLQTNQWNDYRIGDGIAMYTGAPGCDRFPNSIVCEYQHETSEPNDITALIRVLQKQPLVDELPGEVVAFVHVRLGDGLCARHDFPCRGERIDEPDCWNDDRDCWFDKNSITKQYAYSKKWYSTVVEQLSLLHSIKQVVILGDKHHWTRTVDPRDGDYTIDDKYLANMAKYFRRHGFLVQIREPSLPDEDFALLCSAKTFVQGGGGYSALIASVVEVRGGIVIKPGFRVSKPLTTNPITAWDKTVESEHGMQQVAPYHALRKM